MLLSAAFAGPAGPAFSFSAFPSFFHQSLPRLIQRRFSHPLGLPLSRICSQLAHTAPTGPVWDCAGVVPPTWFSKPHTGSHRAELGFTAAFSQPFSVRAPQADAPGGNLPPHEWAGSCKAASRFSRFRLMSTR